MRWNDLREFINRLRDSGDLTDVKGAHWDLEIGVISELMIERGGPALLFDEIPDYPKGFRILTNADRMARKLAITLGLNPDASLADMSAEWNLASKDYEQIPPMVQPTGPVMENVISGSDINLWAFPAPKWHEADGNRYLGTGVCVIQKDPETGFVNVGSYRVAVHDEKTAIIFIEPSKHGDVIRRKYWDRGEKAPVAVSVGQEPILTALGGSVVHCPYGVSELEVAGYLQGSPYPVVLGPVTGLPLPATAEIVFEGYMPSPDQALLPEGPFGEWTGYYGHGRTPETPIEVSAIYHRNNPIIFGSPPVRPISKLHRLGEVDLRTERELEKAGVPGVQRVVTLSAPNFRVVSVRQMYDEHLEDVIRVIAPGGMHHMGNYIWVLVDDDIDVFNTQEVLWAIASRTIPQTAVRTIPGMADWQLDPRIPPGERSDPTMAHAQDRGRQPYRADSLIINACRPFEWKDQFPKVNVNSRELRERTEQKWHHLFS
ncbi:MAG TPA: UbiD family decarboxylase [Chloroflexota bacterium]